MFLFPTLPFPHLSPSPSPPPSTFYFYCSHNVFHCLTNNSLIVSLFSCQFPPVISSQLSLFYPQSCSLCIHFPLHCSLISSIALSFSCLTSFLFLVVFRKPPIHLFPFHLIPFPSIDIALPLHPRHSSCPVPFPLLVFFISPLIGFPSSLSQFLTFHYIITHCCQFIFPALLPSVYLRCVPFPCQFIFLAPLPCQFIFLAPLPCQYTFPLPLPCQFPNHVTVSNQPLSAQLVATHPVLMKLVHMVITASLSVTSVLVKLRPAERGPRDPSGAPNTYTSSFRGKVGPLCWEQVTVRGEAVLNQLGALLCCGHCG